MCSIHYSVPFFAYIFVVLSGKELETLTPSKTSQHHNLQSMENFSYSSFPDSQDSSPRSREIDDNSSWEKHASQNYKVKFVCSYGGKIQPRPHDNQLAYVGGDTKLVAVNRNIKFSSMLTKLASICDDIDVCFKYQYPGEDLDALISVMNDEDLEHMMIEYDRLYRASAAKPTRLRLFLFSLTTPRTVGAGGFGGGEVKSERQWFADALNSVQVQAVQPLEGSSPQGNTTVVNPDLLFGLENGFKPTMLPQPPSVAQDSVSKDISAGSDCGSEDRHLIGEPTVVSQAEFQRQMQDLQRLQSSTTQHDHQVMMLQRKMDEGNPNARIYNAGDYFTTHKMPENIVSAAMPVLQPPQPPIPSAYYSTAAYPVSVSPSSTGNEHPIYLIQTPTGVYQTSAMRPMAVPGQVNQAYYGVHRVGQEVYREPQVYNPMLPLPTSSLQQPKAGMTEPAYVHVGYDRNGRQLFYSTSAALPSYQPVATADGSGIVNQEVKVPSNAMHTQTQTSSGSG